MKNSSLLGLATLAALLTATIGSAQSARQLTRKVVPPPPNQTPARPAPPPPPARVPVAVPPQPPAAVPAPVDPEKEKAKKEEALKKTIEFQKKRAAEGSPSAQYDLGMRYLKGDGLERNEELGRKWLQESAKNDYPLAKKKLEALAQKEK